MTDWGLNAFLQAVRWLQSLSAEELITFAAKAVPSSLRSYDPVALFGITKDDRIVSSIRIRNALFTPIVSTPFETYTPDLGIAIAICARHSPAREADELGIALLSLLAARMLM